jgi:hypothetical protein
MLGQVANSAISCGIPVLKQHSPPLISEAAAPWFWPPPFDSLQKFVISSMAVEANEAN